jgi:hypothetical protein
MARTFRRLVTGLDAKGRSVLVSDTEIAEAGSVGNFDIWMMRAGATPNEAPIPGPFPFFPATGDMIFRTFRIPPDAPGMGPADLAAIAEGFFAAVGDPACRVDTARHPLMHRTPTIDCIMLLSGEAALLLDEGEPVALRQFDVVIERATNHTWLNTGSADAVFLAVMVGVR